MPARDGLRTMCAAMKPLDMYDGRKDRKIKLTAEVSCAG